MIHPFLRFRTLIPHYFSKHPSHELKELYFSVGIMDFATSAVALFEPIYLWTRGYSFAQIAMFYGVVYLLYTILLPLGGRIAARFGFEHSILTSQFAFILYYVTLFALPQFSWLIYVAPLLFAIQKSLYWPAYHADFTIFSAREQRGQEISGVLTVSAVATILGPIFGGIILKTLGFGPLFLIVAILFLASTRPLLKLKEIHDTAPFSYSKYWKLLWKPTHRRSALAYFGYAEELVALVFWPIFLYLTVSEYSELGLLVGAATFGTMLLVLGIGKLTDRSPKPRVLSFGSIAMGAIWFIRTVVSLTPFRLFLLDAVGRTGKNTVTVPLMSMTYEHGIREDPLAIAVYFEQSLAIGKLIICGILIGVAALAPSITATFQIAFFLAGLASLLYRLLTPPGPLGMLHKT